MRFSRQVTVSAMPLLGHSALELIAVRIEILVIESKVYYPKIPYKIRGLVWNVASFNA